MTKPEQGGVLRVGATTFGFLYRASLELALEQIARAGYKLVEIAPVPPHLYVGDFGAARCKQVKNLLDATGLTCVSLNPVELNLISTNPALNAIALDHYRRSIAIAHDLGATVVVVIAGRQSVLIPIPREDALGMAAQQIGRLVPEARDAGVTLAVETVPYGLTDTASQAAALVDAVGDDHVGIALDAANVFGKESAEDSVHAAGDRLRIAHLSDSWRSRWAHTSLGRGEVDLAGFVEALRNSSFRGPTIYELVDGEDPAPRIRQDLATFEGWGMSA